jgi:hypothetical protein
VLDCGAEAFITIPYDAQDLMSAVDDLMHGAEEKKRSSPVRTRFVVTHGGQKYSVVADRRQLLEFLLSTFELAVRVRHEQEQVQKEMLQNIHGQSERLSAIISERDRTITALKTTLAEKEQQESPLAARVEELGKELGKAGETLRNFEHQLVEKGARVSDLEAQLAARVLEKQAAEQKISRLAEEMAAGTERLKAECTATATVLEQERKVRAALEEELGDLREKNAAARQFLDSASRDIGILNAALAEQKEKQKKTEERITALQKENEAKDRIIASLNDDSRLEKGGQAGTPAMPSDGEEMFGKPSPQPVTQEHPPPFPDTPPPPTLTGEPDQNEQKPLFPRPLETQMKLPEPEPAVQLPQPPVQEPAPPVSALSGKEPAWSADAGGPGADTRGAAPDTSITSTKIPKDWKVNRNLWFDMIKWVHHTSTLSPDQRKELLDSLMKTSRLVQQGRHLTSRQEETMRGLLLRMESLGYRFH